MTQNSFTAEQALAALSFLSDSFLLEREKQPDGNRNRPKQASVTMETPAFNHPNEDDDENEEWKKIKQIIPDWVEEREEEPSTVIIDEEEEEDVVQVCRNVDGVIKESSSSSSQQSWLEHLGPDVSALVLSHLSVSELMNVVSFTSKAMYRACRTNELWRSKFVARWNYRNSDNNNWFQAYRAAYSNPHDLWVTHWNCVSPNDGDSPGRCCILSERAATTKRMVNCSDCVRAEKQEEDGTNDLTSPWMKYCPSCRYTCGNSSSSLPLIIQQAINREKNRTNEQDPVEVAETRAAAHALLLQEEDSSTSRARTVFATTQYAIAKWCRNERDILSSTLPLSYSSQRAFLNAATFHRQLNPDQYMSGSLHFLTDVLFFSVVDSHLQHTRRGLEEKEHLRRDVYMADNINLPGTTDTVASLGPSIETSHHTWHIARFTNPDFVRPISFRIFVQRPDCFSVFPSEGFLLPGQTCHIVFGVRLLGSLLSEAFEALNVQREEVDPFLADVYAHEAHLPYAPFAIRYVFAPAVPCIPPSFTSRGGIKPAQSFARSSVTHAATSKYQDMREYLWENVATEATVRTIYLSAHVHANYRFEDFQRATLTPFDLRVRKGEQWGSSTSNRLVDPMVLVAPNLMQKDSTIFEELENLRLEMELSDAGQAARTEKQCEGCARDWGTRSEELGRAHILQVLVCHSFARRKNLLMRNVVLAVRHVYSIFHGKPVSDPSTDMQRVHGLLYVVHGILIQKRADPSISLGQRQFLLRLECLVDELCLVVQDRLVDESDSEVSGEATKGLVDATDVDDERMEDFCSTESPWRNVGAYRFRTCTDSIYGHDIMLHPLETDLPFGPTLKDELDYLDGFRYLCHSPGIYCLGQQQDPNHEDPNILPVFDIKTSPFRRVIPPGKRSRNSDTFMDNHTLAFACALSMIHDPRSLLVHGIYDRVKFPGTIARRPLIPPGLFVKTVSTTQDALMERSSVLAKKWKRQNLERRGVASFECGEKMETVHMKRDSPRMCLQYAELDFESHDLIHLAHIGFERSWQNVTSLTSYQQNIPPPGVGRFPLSTIKKPENVSATVPTDRLEVVPLNASSFGGGYASRESRRSTPVDAQDTSNAAVGIPLQPLPNNNNNNNGNQNARLPPFMAGHAGNGPRVVNLLWLMSAHFGWAIDDTQGAGSVLVDRKILIATQWVSNSLMTLPLLWTLMARYVKWITSKPMNYYLEGLPHEVSNEMRYLTAAECGKAAVLVLALWLIMGRYAERRISRSFERAMMEHLSTQTGGSTKSRMFSCISIWFQRQWDRVSPLFLQHLVFTPRWNHRSDTDVQKHLTAWRSKDLREHRSDFVADNGRGVVTHGASVEDGGPPIDYKEESPIKKILTGLVVSLGSFSASSPHFFLNLLTVFSCSIALGMSMSLQSMEVGRQTKNAGGAHSTLKPLALNTIVIMSFLVGQLIGSSGGVLFLAEFVVTTVSLVLGGAGTISASAMESWGCFFCLSSTAFWGYLFARVALIDGIRHKRRRPSSVVLCTCLVVIAGLWFGCILLWNWEMPPNLMILRPQPHRSTLSNKVVSHRLQ